MTDCWISTKHPELKDGECLLGNTTRPEFHFRLPQINGYPHRPDQYYDLLSLKSKQKGNIAYDANNNILEELYPVIVNIDEYESYLISIKCIDHCRPETISRIKDKPKC